MTHDSNGLRRFRIFLHAVIFHRAIGKFRNAWLLARHTSSVHSTAAETCVRAIRSNNLSGQRSSFFRQMFHCHARAAALLANAIFIAATRAFAAGALLTFYRQ